MRGLLNGTDPIELLKSTEVDGFKNTDRAVQDEAAKIRQYYLTFRIGELWYSSLLVGLSFWAVKAGSGMMISNNFLKNKNWQPLFWAHLKERKNFP